MDEFSYVMKVAQAEHEKVKEELKRFKTYWEMIHSWDIPGNPKPNQISSASLPERRIEIEEQTQTR